MTVWDLVVQRLAATPDDVMAVDPDGRTVTFAELHQRALDLAARLAGQGIGPGVVVSWQLPTWIEGTVLCLALARLGAVQNPLIPMLRHSEVTHITRQARSRFLVVPPTWRGFEHEAMAREIAAAAADLTVIVAQADGVRTTSPAVGLPTEPGEAGVRWLFYTSGTTSEPKGAQHADAGLVHAARAMVARVGVTGDDIMGQPAPLTHVGGVILTLVSLLTGCRLLLEDTFDPARTPRVFQDATLIGTGTPFFQAYLGYDDAHPGERPLFPRVRAFLSGGAPKPVVLDGQLRRRFGAGIVSGYGMTECPMLAWNAPTDTEDVLARTEGRPVDGVQVRVIDGELCVRGPQLMTGYVDASLDEEAFTADGFLRTGDLVAVDPAGNITVTGRVKDIIIRNLENISAREVEELLLTHPAVREVAVIGLPDDQTGERVCAVVVPAEGPAPDLASLAVHFREQGVSARKLPAQLELVDALPRNAMLKVEKAALRRRFAVGVS